MRRSWIMLVVTGLLCCGLPLAVSQEPAANDPLPPVSESPEQSGETEQQPPSRGRTSPAAAPSDPTVPSEQLKAILGQQRAVQTSAPPTKLPALRIKGRVASPDGDVLVLLQIGQQMERVTADTEWTTEDGLTITVLSISLSELRLQIQPQNRTVTIR